MSAAASAGFPARAAPTARAKCVIASVYGVFGAGRTVSAIASAHWRRSIAYRAGMAAIANVLAPPPAGPGLLG